jgi:hypothetical protein
MPYAYKDLPLTPAIAAPLVIEKLRNSNRPIKRSELSAYVGKRHGDLGGLPAQNLVLAVKKALHNLTEDKQIEAPGWGYYSLSNLDDSPVVEGEFEPPDTSPIPELDDQFVPEETLGEGPETVYVYFNAAERELARLTGKDHWPCKVGFTASTLQSRILGQGVMTGMARLPIVGLVILTSTGQRLERAIHFALDEADARIDEAAGTEWFDTSPARIKAWYLSHSASVHLLQEGLISKADT